MCEVELERGRVEEGRYCFKGELLRLKISGCGEVVEKVTVCLM
jgi:hypothetical protein